MVKALPFSCQISKPIIKLRSKISDIMQSLELPFLRNIIESTVMKILY
jgi:hypothetical protein